MKQQTLKEKYNLISHGNRLAVMKKVANKLNFSYRHFYWEKFKKEVLSDTESKFVHKVFDLQIEWQDKIEKKHYDNLCK